MAIQRTVKPIRGNYVLWGGNQELRLENVTEQEALDREEDICYALLEKGIDPPEIEVWQFDLDWKPVCQVQCSC